MLCLRSNVHGQVYGTNIYLPTKLYLCDSHTTSHDKPVTRMLFSSQMFLFRYIPKDDNPEQRAKFKICQGKNYRF